MAPPQGSQTSYTGSGIPQKRFQEIKEQALRLVGLRHHLVSFPPHSVDDRPATRPARLRTIKSTYGKYYCVHLCKNTIVVTSESRKAWGLFNPCGSSEYRSPICKLANSALPSPKNCNKPHQHFKNASLTFITGNRSFYLSISF